MLNTVICLLVGLGHQSIYEHNNLPTGRGARIGKEMVSSAEDPTHGRVKPMTYQIDTCHFEARCSALLG